MQRLPVLLLSGAVALACPAQPTILAADHMPLVGTSRTLYQALLTEDEPPGGENVTWDYHSLSGGEIPVNYLEPTDAQFTGATVDAFSGDGTHRYFSLEPEGLIEHGIDVTVYTCPWDNPMTVLEPQMTFDDQAIDDYGGTCSGIIARTGTYEITADGWGTLLLPNNTFSDVLRIHGYKEYEDVFFGTPTPSRENIYEYYVQGVVEPVLSTLRAETSINGVWTQTLYSANYVNEIGLGFAEGGAVGFDVFPNPVHDWLNIAAPAPLSRYARMELRDALGRVVRSKNLSVATFTSLAMRSDMSDLPAGPYLVCLRNSDGDLFTRRVVKE